MKIPPQIIDALSNAPGFEPTAFCRTHESGEQVVSIRLNPSKQFDATFLDFSLGEKVPWTETGFYLNKRPAFTKEPLLHAGAFYVQEASSMFLEAIVKQVVDLDTPLAALDLCAAPGGKSSHLLSLLSPESVLVSNEVIRSRANILEENLVKWGAANSIITNNDPRDFSGLGGIFDLVLVDAPCSGSGMMRKDPEIAGTWNVDLVNLCFQRQQRILADCWPVIKEGGLLIYSTCSYSVEENEQVADWLVDEMGAEPVLIDVPPEWNLHLSKSEVHKAPGYRFYPDRVRGEGFYLAVFKKQVAADEPARRKQNLKWELAPKLIQSQVRNWLKPDGQLIVVNQENLLALPENTEKYLQLLTSMYIRKAGIRLGKWAGNNLVPDHALALSQLNGNEVPVWDLNREQAMNYLRKVEMEAPGIPKGWVLVQYAGQNLGWLKQLGNRTNNYYPKEWRILQPA